MRNVSTYFPLTSLSDEFGSDTLSEVFKGQYQSNEDLLDEVKLLKLIDKNVVSNPNPTFDYSKVTS